MKDKVFKKLCLEKPYLARGFDVCYDMPNYNPDFCCNMGGTYLVYESESGSNKKAHIGAFLEACYAAKQKNASMLYMFFVQKEYKKNITVNQLPGYFRPYVEMMKKNMHPISINVYFISDLDFIKLKNKSDSILDTSMLSNFVSI